MHAATNIFFKLCDLLVQENLTPSVFGSLLENAKLIDVYLFLFDEFLLITKIKRNKKVRYYDPSWRFTGVDVQSSVCAESFRFFTVCPFFLRSGPSVRSRIP